VTLSSPLRQATSLLESRFATRASVAVSAPGRVNLIGEHTDYNGGPVLPVALQRRTVVAASVAEGWAAASAELDESVQFDPERPRGGWTDYLAGVVRELRAVRATPRGARLSVASAVPLGAGLASSAALAVAAAKALSLLAGRRLDPDAVAEIAYRAEHDRVGVRCGRMDQTVAALARPRTALLFDTATGAVDHVPFDGALCIVETGVAHRLAAGALNQRRRECEEALALCRQRWPGLPSLAALSPDDLPLVERKLPPALAPRARHVVREAARTREAARALAHGDLRCLGALLVEGHRSLRDDFGSTIPEADLIVERAVHHGAHGARLSGAGWGGAVLVLAPPTRSERILADVASDFREAFGRVPAMWRTRAGGGVRRETIV
jgi:galactokinase